MGYLFPPVSHSVDSWLTSHTPGGVSTLPLLLKIPHKNFQVSLFLPLSLHSPVFQKPNPARGGYCEWKFTINHSLQCAWNEERMVLVCSKVNSSWLLIKSSEITHELARFLIKVEIAWKMALNISTIYLPLICIKFPYPVVCDALLDHGNTSVFSCFVLLTHII